MGPFSIKFSLIDFAVDNELSLSPCMHTESISQGICFPLWQLSDWFLTIFNTCFLAKKHVLNMVKNQSLNCHSGKQIPCEIDSVCIHGDNESSLSTAKSIRENLIENGPIFY